MKNYRLLLLVVSYVFLCGFNHSAGHLPIQPDIKKQRAIKRSTIGIAGKATVDDDKELQPPLDLTIPFNDVENAEKSTQTLDKDSGAQNAVDTLFTEKPKKAEQPLQLKGGWLMSPEPETEKRKSVDGAGIVIDLKP